MKIHKPRDIHMTSDARLLCLQSDWFRQHSGANARKPVHLYTYFYHSPFPCARPVPCARPQRAHANTYGPRDYLLVSRGWLSPSGEGMLLHGFIDARHPHLIWMAWSESPFAGSDFCLFLFLFFSQLKKKRKKKKVYQK